MTVIDRPWMFRDDDGRPHFRTSWHEESRADGSERWHGPVERKAFEPHDRQTLALIQRLDELGRFRHGEAVGPLLEEWRWRDSMHGPAEKQRFLEPLIQRTKRDPDANEGVLIFLLLVCEGVRRGVARELLAARTGLEGPSTAPAFHRREEARRIREIERERLFDVTRMATLEALYRYPSPPPANFFVWLRETIAHRTLDFLRGELSELRTSSLVGEDAEAMQAFLSGLEDAVPPALADGRGLARWRRRIGVRPLYEAVAGCGSSMGCGLPAAPQLTVYLADSDPSSRLTSTTTSHQNRSPASAVPHAPRSTTPRPRHSLLCAGTTASSPLCVGCAWCATSCASVSFTRVIRRGCCPTAGASS